jgi:NAD(P)-dependent dehydrogenase (short-subunit alcohol dehydrogenase family)
MSEIGVLLIKRVFMNVVITGASKGIGYALAKKFALSGHSVMALARSSSLLAKLEEEVKQENDNALIIARPFDLLHGDIKGELFKEIQHRFSHIDVLINNAGILVAKPFQELTDDDFDKSFDINVKAVFRMVRDLGELLREGTHIVNISSMGGYQGSAKFPGLSVYSAAKGAVAVLSECLAEEFKEKGIKVNALAIGAVQTEMLAEAFPGYQAPLQPQEMADFMLDFALNGHRYFNGKILPVSLSTP